MTIDTRKVKRRRRLRFDTLDQMLAHAERLVAGGTEQLGNWSLGQNLHHLALIQTASIDGFPKLWPRPVRWLMRLCFKRWLLRNGFPPSGPNVNTLRPEPIDAAAAALENFRAATDRVRNETKRSPHPVFGSLTLDEWTLGYLRHAELHMSFCVPAGETDGSAKA